MENRNIYKLDDVLLALSVILLIPAFYFAWPWVRGLPDVHDMVAYIQAAPTVLGSRILYVLSYMAGAVLTQAAGRTLRYQEKLSLKILDEIGYSRKVRISEISSRLGMSEGKVEKLVGKLSRVSSLNISIEGDRIVKSREPAASPPEGTGSRDSEIRGGDGIRREIMGKETLSPILDHMKKTGERPSLEEIRRIGGKIKREMETETESRDEDVVKMPFSLPVMGLLLFLFLTPLWPVSLVLFIRKAVKQRGMSRNDEA